MNEPTPRFRQIFFEVYESLPRPSDFNLLLQRFSGRGIIRHIPYHLPNRP